MSRCEYQTTWRDVVGYEGDYKVTQDGRVFSIKPITLLKNGGEPKELYQWLVHHKYPSVRLCKNAIVKPIHVHVLVASAFIGPRPQGMHVAHKDGNPKNNNMGNLRYATPQENEADKLIHGTRFYGKGETASQAKLKNSDVLEIRLLLKQGAAQSELAKRFGVDRSMISHIKRGKHWSHLGEQDVA